MKQTVAISSALSYGKEVLDAALKEALSLAGDFDVKGKKVLLKPNILRDAAVERAVTTHPKFVGAVIRICFEYGASAVFVGDSPGVHRSGFDGRTCGIRDITEREGAEWIDFKGTKTTRNSPSALREKSFHFTDIIDESDVLISLPKLKTHELMYYTGAMKNLYGLIPGYAKAAIHVKYPGRDDFGRMIVDLVGAARPQYALMDGIIAMEGPGPGNGYPRSVGVVGASASTFAMDIVFSQLIGYNPTDIPSNRYAFGILDGIESVKDVEVRGLDLSQVQAENFQKIEKKPARAVPRFLNRFGFFHKLETRLRPKPRFDHEHCILCGECVAMCASKALEIRGTGEARRVTIDYRRCIRCYCCHEICPVNAIQLHTMK